MGAGASSRVITTELSEQSVNLLLNNTHKNKEEIAAFHAAFLKESPSGKVDKALFAKLFAQLHENDAKKAKADKYAEHVFK
jgi:Ca2+-binding EF-hand superfamily protein